MFMSDNGYRTKVYSDIRYNVRLCALHSDIGRSDIRLSLISLITIIGLSAHLWLMLTAESIYCEIRNEYFGHAVFLIISGEFDTEPLQSIYTTPIGKIHQAQKTAATFLCCFNYVPSLTDSVIEIPKTTVCWHYS
jgi:hypothetical protein